MAGLFQYQDTKRTRCIALPPSSSGEVFRRQNTEQFTLITFFHERENPKIVASRRLPVKADLNVNFGRLYAICESSLGIKVSPFCDLLGKPYFIMGDIKNSMLRCPEAHV